MASSNRLTWQNVTAPDFSAAINSQKYASEALDKALGRVSNIVTDFDNSLRDREIPNSVLIHIHFGIKCVVAYLHNGVAVYLRRNGKVTCDSPCCACDARLAVDNGICQQPGFRRKRAGHYTRKPDKYDNKRHCK